MTKSVDSPSTNGFAFEENYLNKISLTNDVPYYQLSLYPKTTAYLNYDLLKKPQAG